MRNIDSHNHFQNSAPLVDTRGRLTACFHSSNKLVDQAFIVCLVANEPGGGILAGRRVGKWLPALARTSRRPNWVVQVKNRHIRRDMDQHRTLRSIQGNLKILALAIVFDLGSEVALNTV